MAHTNERRAQLRRQDLGWVWWPVLVMVPVVATGCTYPELHGPPQFTSCMGLAATCGPGMNESCCSAKAVPGGTFYRSYDGTTLHPDMGSPATVSPYALDVYEVTVGRFRAFVNAGYGTQGRPPAAGSGGHPQLSGSGWDAGWNTNLAATTTDLVSAVNCPTYGTWTPGAGASDTRAMNCVTWFEAMAFCIWDGGYLPTDAEWNYAASGGVDQRAYPWSVSPASSTAIDCTYANYLINNPIGAHCMNGTPDGVNRVGSESPKGDGRWNQADLAGNVWEWTLDWYTDSYPNPCNDCANMTDGTYRVIRGGSFDSDASFLRAADRDQDPPANRDGYLGFRCARTP
jgi:formylglycine-generating enzyme required for sulfatase activity